MNDMQVAVNELALPAVFKRVLRSSKCKEDGALVATSQERRTDEVLPPLAFQIDRMDAMQGRLVVELNRCPGLIEIVGTAQQPDASSPGRVQRLVVFRPEDQLYLSVVVY